MKKKFNFGQNWLNYIGKISTTHILNAENSLKEIIEEDDLNNIDFCDVGAGSGLLSLAAHRLGARVFSFDNDDNCIKSINILKNKYSLSLDNWEINQGSILDDKYVLSIGKYDLVYSWGVLHHTGNMYHAFNNVNLLVKKGGHLIIAIYNKQFLLSAYWTIIKKIYSSTILFRPILILFHLPLVLPSLLKSFLFNSKIPRGMLIWNDYIDWLGGYPFETSSRDDVVKFYEKKGYSVKKIKSVGNSLGCNEYVFIKN